ncbi:MAG: hypothetical protein K0Q87_3758 [Neobacillus sp.]|nr:hypothetical protein [Neobacillus sp.]
MGICHPLGSLVGGIVKHFRSQSESIRPSVLCLFVLHMDNIKVLYILH